MNNSVKKHFLKLMSLVFAATLWFYVLNSEPITIEKSIKLSLLPPSGMSVNVEVPKEVKVVLKGSRTFLNNLNFEKEKLFIELSEYPNQETFAVTFDKKMVPVPFGIDVQEILPQQIVLSLEKEIKKFVPLRLKLIGDVQKDLKVVKRNLEPTEVMISGPRSVLKQIGQIHTAPIDLSTLEGNGKMAIPLEVIDSRVSIDLQTDPVFDYSIRPNTANFSLKKIKILFLSNYNSVSSNLKTVTLDVLVPESKMSTLNESDVKVIAEIPPNQPGKHRVQLKAQMPEGVHLLQIHPEYINVTVK